MAICKQFAFILRNAKRHGNHRPTCQYFNVRGHGLLSRPASDATRCRSTSTSSFELQARALNLTFDVNSMSILSTFLRFPALRSSRSYTGGGATACVQFPSLLPSAPRTPRSYLWSSLRASQHDSTQRAAKMTPQLREAASAIVRSPEPTFYETMEKPGVTRQVLVSRQLCLSATQRLTYSPRDQFVGITCGLVLTFAAVRTTIETDYWTQKMLLLIPHFEVRGPQNATNEYVRDEAKGRYIQVCI